MTRKMPGPRLLNGKSAADYLGVPYNTLRGWVSRGTVPVIRVPHSRSLWFAVADLDQFIDRNREGSHVTILLKLS